LVLGAGGAGKSRLSREMAEILDLPIIHLDTHYWKPEWVESEKDSFPTGSSSDTWRRIGGGRGPRCCGRSRPSLT